LDQLQSRSVEISFIMWVSPLLVPSLCSKSKKKSRPTPTQNFHKLHQPPNSSNMKRKLDENDVPAPAEEEKKLAASFADFGLDPRLLQAIAKLKLETPTTVQIKAIPLALDGRHILARAKTGSGKTLAYLIPIVQSIIKKKELGSLNCISALILVPTKELAQQVYNVINDLLAFCTDFTAVNITQRGSPQVLRSLLDQLPDIVVATPAGAAAHFSTSSTTLESLLYLAIDEADLVLSYGYEEDLQNVSKSMPKGVQTILMSATLTDDVETLKGLFCINPAVLKLEEAESDGEGVSQYVAK
jgi:ATP-dependent RNA helicase DDX56/DBP9